MSHDDSDSGTAEPTSSDRASQRDDSGITRRHAVAAGATTWATVALAGCSDGGDGGDGEDDGDGGDTASPADGGTDGTTPTEDGGMDTPEDGTAVSTETTTTEDPETQTEAPPTTTSCAGYSAFAPGMEIGFHVNVVDETTGAVLGEDSLDGVTVAFPNAEFDSFELNWSGPHEEYAADDWGGLIEADEDADPGTYQYEVRLEDGEDTTTRTGTFRIV